MSFHWFFDAVSHTTDGRIPDLGAFIPVFIQQILRSASHCGKCGGHLSTIVNKTDIATDLGGLTSGKGERD